MGGIPNLDGKWYYMDKHDQVRLRIELFTKSSSPLLVSVGKSCCEAACVVLQVQGPFPTAQMRIWYFQVS